MAIQPIDLQTLFTQLDKVGKSQANQKEGLQIQQALQDVRIQQKTEERIRSVNESQDTGEGTEGVKDRSPRNQNDREAPPRGSREGEDAEEDRPVICDPDLGRNIDLSG